MFLFRLLRFKFVDKKFMTQLCYVNISLRVNVLIYVSGINIIYIRTIKYMWKGHKEMSKTNSTLSYTSVR